ncbi:hypothetical protein EB118_23885 [bacterium]|nr:hypothetical protein [bacterium]NDC95143.1 hypothetical protein [bacterium]NDD84887.1 hypothetical protein [bacterium]NDG33094.1 hypothetical protein [bacterium]
MGESYIYSPGVDKNSVVNEFYTLVGLEDFVDLNNNPRLNKETDDNIFAKKTVRADSSVRYSVRLSKDGKIYNPMSIYGQETSSAFLDRVCRASGKFKDVNYKTFDLYVNFLKTKNVAWLHNAEREAE